MKSRRPWTRTAIRISSGHFFTGKMSLVVFVAASVLMTSLNIASPGTMQNIRLSIMDAFSPFISAINYPFQKTVSGIEVISGLANLRAENTRLKTENDRLKEWYHSALLLQAENKSLRKILDVTPDPVKAFITTRVIGDGGSAFVRSFLIEAGADQGIEKGQPVMAGEGLIGRVIESGTRSARVLLITDVNSHIPVVIEGTNMRAVLAGTNDKTLSLQHLPLDTNLSEGARIVTSGIGGLFPPGLPVGVVGARDGQYYTVKPFAQSDRVSFVRIIDAYDPDRLDAEQSADSIGP